MGEGPGIGQIVILSILFVVVSAMFAWTVVDFFSSLKIKSSCQPKKESIPRNPPSGGSNVSRPNVIYCECSCEYCICGICRKERCVNLITIINKKAGEQYQVCADYKEKIQSKRRVD